MQGNTIGRHGGKLRLRADGGVWNKNADPGAEPPTIRLPHGCLLSHHAASLAARPEIANRKFILSSSFFKDVPEHSGQRSHDAAA
jgi:hypothetical protein